MPKLIIKNEQIGIEPNEIHNIRSGMTPVDVLMVYLPDGIDPESTKIYLNTTEINVLDEDLMTKPISNNQIITVVKEVKGIETAVLVASILISIAVYASMPDIPGDAGVTKESPNNSHTEQTNIARAYQGLPVVFGSPECYPDLIGSPITEYIGGEKFIRQFMCVNYALSEVEAIKILDTPIGDFNGIEYSLIEPVNEVATVDEYIASNSIQGIDGQELIGADSGSSGEIYNVTAYQGGDAERTGSVFTLNVSKDTTSDLLKSDFDSSSLFSVQLDCQVTDPDGPPTDYVATGTITDITLSGDSLYYTITISRFDGAPVATEYVSPFVITRKSSIGIGPFNTQVLSKELWFSFEFPNGLNGTSNITIGTTILDGKNGNPVDGTYAESTVTYTDTTLSPVYKTRKIIFPNEEYFLVTIQKTNTTSNDPATPNLTIAESGAAITRESDKEFGNVTILDVSIPASSNASLRENKISVDLTSKLITYENGAIDYTPRASRKMADAILTLHVNYYGLDPDLLDLDGLYEIQNRLDAIDERLATFDFTFDDLDVGYEDQIDSILQVARCYKWLDGNVYRFARDEKREFESTVITRRDIANESDREYSYSYSPNLGSYDSVKLEYIDKDTNSKAYIYRKLDSSGDVVDGVGVNPISIELAGCKEVYNAINRAELEMRKLMYQREKLSDTLLPSGMFLDKGDMFLYAEQYNKSDSLFDGEIVAIEGNTATTSEQLFFDGVSSYVVHYTDENGDSLGPFAISEVAGNANQFTCSSLSDVYVRDSKLGYLVQTGSRYIISTVEELEQSRWTLVEKEPSGRNVQVTAVNYDERIYEYDEE